MVVPCEYVGRSRAFINKIEESDRLFLATRDAIVSELVNRMNRKPSFRHAESIDLLRLWASTERCFGQIACSKLIYKKRRVEFVGVRLMKFMGQRWDWNGDAYEQAACICTVRLVAEAKMTIKQELHCIATLSLHCLARHFQRALEPSENGLLDAIWSSVPAVRNSLCNGKQGSVSLPSSVPGGSWHCEVTYTTLDGDQDNRGLSFLGRTFFHCDNDD